MGCRICGRSSCTESFHSPEQQEEFNKYADMSDSDLIGELIGKDEEIKELNDRICELEEWQSTVPE